MTIASRPSPKEERLRAGFDVSLPEQRSRREERTWLTGELCRGFATVCRLAGGAEVEVIEPPAARWRESGVLCHKNALSGIIRDRMVQVQAARQPLLYVVDDDVEMRRLLEQYFGRHGFDVVTLKSADELLHRIGRRRPDIVVLDLMMPGTGGLEALRRLRSDGDDIPLILLTALSTEKERIRGLDLGADDYLGKPFNPRELLSRVHAVLRRRTPLKLRLPEQDEPIGVGRFVLDPLRRAVTLDGVPVPLTDSDFTLLRAMVGNPLKPLSRTRLVEMSGRPPGEAAERAINVHILRLRRILELDPDNPTLLQTVRGIGYVYVPQ